MSELSETLKQEAVDLGLCKQWTEAWNADSDQQTLIDKYKSGIDFILKNKHWPSNDFIKANFNRALLNANLVFVDERIAIDEAESGVYVLNGDCSGTITFAPWAAATVYARHHTKVRIVARDFAKVFVRLYDSAEAEAETDGTGAVKNLDRRGG